MAFKVNATKVKGPATPSPRTPFVLGSRPQGVRAPSPPRIKPAAASTTNYGKTPDPNPAGASFGNTSMTGMS